MKMTYFIKDQNLSLMKESFFTYRNKMINPGDEIISIVEDEFSTSQDLVKAQIKLLELEGQYRSLKRMWNSPSVKLNTIFQPKYSL